jgi:hypothetical protein
MQNRPKVFADQGDTTIRGGCCVSKTAASNPDVNVGLKWEVGFPFELTKFWICAAHCKEIALVQAFARLRNSSNACKRLAA